MNYKAVALKVKFPLIRTPAHSLWFVSVEWEWSKKENNPHCYDFCLKKFFFSPVVLLTSYIYKLKIFPKLCDHVLVIITDKSRPLTRPLPRHHWSRHPLLIGRTRTPISNPVNSPRPRYNLHSVLISLTEEWRGQGHDAKRWQILVTEQSKEVGWRWGWCVVVVVGGGILLMGL